MAGSTANYVQPAPMPGLPNPAGISNVLTDYNWEYVWHCHLLGHEENDMMRPIIFHPAGTYSAATGLTVTANFNPLVHANGTTMTFTANGTGSNYLGVPNTYYQYRFYLDGALVDQTGAYSGDKMYSPPLLLAPGVHTVAADVRTNFTSANPDFSTVGSPLSFTVTNGHDFGSVAGPIDGKSDLWWRNTTNGDLGIWYMNGGSLLAGGAQVLYPGVDLNWVLIGTGDFNSDGSPDLLWWNQTAGAVGAWYMNGSTFTSSTVFANVPDTNWVPVGTGDFNSSDKPDILWWNKATGDIGFWYMNGVALTSPVVIASGVPLDWMPVGTGDFDGDGNTDIVWRNQTTGDVGFWYMNGVNIKSTPVPFPGVDVNWKLVGALDLNNDGQQDLLWRNQTTGDVGVWYMNGSNLSSTLPNQVVIAPGISLNWDLMAR